MRVHCASYTIVDLRGWDTKGGPKGTEVPLCRATYVPIVMILHGLLEGSVRP